MNSICIDDDYAFSRRYAVTPVNVSDSLMLAHLLDPGNEHDYFWVDSAHSCECVERLLSFFGFESLIHEKGVRNHPLSDAAKELYRIKSAIKACVEHFFRSMTMLIGGKLTREIWLVRTEAWWGLNILTLNLLHYLQHTSNITIVILNVLVERHKLFSVIDKV
jgi:hypothetical protein